MYGLGGGREPYFFETWLLPLTVWGFLPVLVRFQIVCTAPLPSLPGALWGGGGVIGSPPHFGGGNLKFLCLGKVGIVGELYEGKIMKNGVGYDCW